jgi:hypothetical protein
VKLEKLARLRSIFNGPEMVAKLKELIPAANDGFVTYGEVWKSFRPHTPWGPVPKREVGNALGRLTHYCVTKKHPILSVLLVNAKDRAMTDKAIENVYNACKELGISVGSDPREFVLGQIEKSRSFYLNA